MRINAMTLKILQEQNQTQKATHCIIVSQRNVQSRQIYGDQWSPVSGKERLVLPFNDVCVGGGVIQCFEQTVGIAVQLLYKHTIDL